MNLGHTPSSAHTSRRASPFCICKRENHSHFLQESSVFRDWSNVTSSHACPGNALFSNICQRIQPSFSLCHETCSHPIHITNLQPTLMFCCFQAAYGTSFSFLNLVTTLVAVWSLESYSGALRISFLTYKMVIIKVPTSGDCCWNKINIEVAKTVADITLILGYDYYETRAAYGTY